MRKLSLFLFWTACALAQTTTPTAIFPGGVATDNQFKVLRDRLQTTLTAPAAPSDTTLNVAAGSNFAANMIVTINSEQIAVCAKTSSTLTVGHSSCPNADGRGFGGTAAASAAAGAAVSVFVDAWHMSAPRVEIEAIEQHTGPVFNVLGFGAKCDGTTNDAAAFNAAWAAAGAAGGTVFVPKSAVCLLGSTVTMQPNVEMTGGGTLKPGAANTVMFAITGAAVGDFGTNASIKIHDITFDASAFFQNSVIGIRETLVNSGYIDHCKFIQVGQNAVLDRANSVDFTGNTMIDDAQVWVGSTSATIPQIYSSYGLNNHITGNHHMLSVQTASNLVLNKPLYKLSRIVSAKVTGNTVQAVLHRMIGISVENDSQGNIITGNTFVQATIGIQLLGSTVDGVFGLPNFTNVRNNVIDQFSQWGILVDIGTLLNQIDDNQVTGSVPNNGTEIAQIEIRGGGAMIQVSGNLLQDNCVGNGIILDTPSTDTSVLHNKFWDNFTTVASGECPGGSLDGSDILTGTQALPGLHIEGNTRGSLDTSAAFIFNRTSDGGSGDQIVVNNVGIDTVFGADLSSTGTNVTLHLSNPVHRVTGSGTISGIDVTSPFGPPRNYTGLITLIPVGSGPTWTLVEGGNIRTPWDAPYQAMPGQAVTLQYTLLSTGVNVWYVIGGGQGTSTGLAVFSTTGSTLLTVDDNGFLWSRWGAMQLGGVHFLTGLGSPSGVVTGNPGDLYLNASGGANVTLWVKESGAATNTGWVAK